MWRVREIDLISSLYRTLLRRQPDPAGLAHHVGRIKSAGLDQVISAFVSSDEFRSLIGSAANPAWLSNKQNMQVTTHVAPDELDRLWAHVAEVWSRYGEEEPYWSVLTDERFRVGADEATMAEFYASGLGDVERLEDWLARSGIPCADLNVVAEYGCGVGRATRWLVDRFASVRAFDISKPHLQAAEQYLSRLGRRNVEFIHVRDRTALARLGGIDLFFSIIVLQHNPPPIIADILARACAGLRPGGVAFFQVPTYSQEYSFDTASFWRDTAASKSMEMHFVPQVEILKIAAQAGFQILEVQPDYCVGNYDKWVSNTFLMRKR